MHKSQKGFTLIELVVVIVLLGILGVTALGKYQDLAADAQTAVNEGIASELSSASAINYAASIIGTADQTIGSATTCAVAAAGLFATGTINAKVSVTGGAITCPSIGSTDSSTCSVAGSGTPAGTAFSPVFICTST